MLSTAPVVALLSWIDSDRPTLGQSSRYSSMSCDWPSVRSTSTVKLEPLVEYQASAMRLPEGFAGF